MIGKQLNLNTTVVGLRNLPLAEIVPDIGQALIWNGNAWIPTWPDENAITSVNAGLGLMGGGDAGDITLSLAAPLSIELGGTGQGTAPAALAALGAVPEPTDAGNFLRTGDGQWIDGLPLTGGTISGQIYMEGALFFGSPPYAQFLIAQGNSVLRNLQVIGTFQAMDAAYLSQDAQTAMEAVTLQQLEAAIAQVPAGPQGDSGPLGLQGPPGPGLIDFSLTEQDTGLLWVDGRKIYQRVVDGGNLPGPSSLKYVPHGITGLLDFTESYGFGVASAYQFPFPFLDPSPAGNSVAFWLEPLNIAIQTGGTFDRSDATTKFILRYTCTDR